MLILRTLIALLLVAGSVAAQYETADDSLYANIILPRDQLRWIIDTPTAGMLSRGAFAIDLRTFPAGGVQVALRIGLMERFSFGVAYGATDALTDNKPEWNRRPEFQLRYRILEERPNLPAIVLGFSSQGYGRYDQDQDRYMVKSLGFYAVLSKSAEIGGNPAGWHWGINYSLETKEDSDPSFFAGFNADLGSHTVILGEYDFALNDNKRYSVYGLGRGYLNVGLAWYATDGLSLELDLKNLFRNREGTDAIDREARLVYVQYFY